MKKSSSEKPVIFAVSGGPDSIYLVIRGIERGTNVLAAHFNHKARGKDSEADERFVERFCRNHGVPLKIGTAKNFSERKSNGSAGSVKGPRGFEEKARRERRGFLAKVKSDTGSTKIVTAHTADDQVETVLMRIFEGSGISGLKGIPRKTSDGFERPIMDTWRKDLLGYLRKRKIPFRIDRSNMDIRFERNWIRHVLIPALEKRYGKSVKKRIFTAGERFREIDEFMDLAARRWIKRNVEENISAGIRLNFMRKAFGKIPSVLRIKILQIFCFERLGFSPNERLLEAMDRLILTGGPSSRLNIGKGAILRCRYEKAVIEKPPSAAGTMKTIELKNPDEVKDVGYESVVQGKIVRKKKGKMAASSLRRLAENGRNAVFDADLLENPVKVRPLRQGDRIRPFGMKSEKKIKEILIDRKIPADERWGRPVLCDANGDIVWIPGIARSAHAPVTGNTRRTVIFSVAPSSAIPD